MKQGIKGLGEDFKSVNGFLLSTVKESPQIYFLVEKIAEKVKQGQGLL